MARRILEASGVVDERDSHGCTPLIRASEALRPGLVAFLLASGADHTIRFYFYFFMFGTPDDSAPYIHTYIYTSMYMCLSHNDLV